MPYVIEGPKWGAAAYGTGVQVTWSFADLVLTTQLSRSYSGYPDFTYTLNSSYRDTIRRAFDAWDDVAKIDFVEVSDSVSSNIRLGQRYIDGRAAPGQTSTLARTSMWWTGSTYSAAAIVFDDDAFDTLDKLYWTAVHEIGHALGLDHSPSAFDVMYPLQVATSQHLSSDDIAGVRFLYGSETPGITREGTDAADILTGGAGDDFLIGKGGNDVLNGLAGDDLVWAGPGDDQVGGGPGNDIILGELGNDALSGNDGNDKINGGPGDDIIWGGAGADELGGGTENDIILGEDGNDVMFGEAGNDRINGGLGDDIATGGPGNDEIGGGDGADILIGDDGDDVLFGEAGPDQLSGGFGNDILVGGAGDDLLGGDAGNDVLVGGDGNDTIFAGAGDDRANGGEGNDVLLGNEGIDELGGGGGDDTIQGGLGNDTLFGEAGSDTLEGGGGNDVLIGGAGDDRFVFRAGDGADRISDFVAGGTDDHVWFVGTNLTSFAQVQAAATFDSVQGGTMINYNGGSVFVAFVSPGQLTADDFIFS